MIVAMVSSPDDFGSHVFDRTAEAVGPLLMRKKLFGKAEVGEDHVAVAVQQDVLQFDVSIDDAELKR